MSTPLGNTIDKTIEEKLSNLLGELHTPGVMIPVTRESEGRTTLREGSVYEYFQDYTVTDGQLTGTRKSIQIFVKRNHPPIAEFTAERFDEYFVPQQVRIDHDTWKISIRTIA